MRALWRNEENRGLREDDLREGEKNKGAGITSNPLPWRGSLSLCLLKMQEGPLTATWERESENTMSCARQVAMVLRERGQHAEAARVNGSCLPFMRRVLGEEHPDTLDAMHLLAAFPVPKRQGGEGPQHVEGVPAHARGGAGPEGPTHRARPGVPGEGGARGQVRALLRDVIERLAAPSGVFHAEVQRARVALLMDRLLLPRGASQE